MGIYMRVNSVEQLEGIKKVKEEKSMMERIQDSGRVGYAYFYPNDGGKRQEFYISNHLIISDRFACIFCATSGLFIEYT